MDNKFKENIKCAVLLATYNGEKYINEQLVSILNQIDVDITLYVSDDMSTDCTIELVQSFKNNSIIILPQVGRMGSASQNFFRLISDVNFSTYDYVAFSDQDDIWYDDKLSRAILAIKEKKLGGYSSNVMAFWESGDRILINKSAPQKKFDYLFSSPGPGCTQVFSREFMQDFKNTLLKHKLLSKKIDLHDWIIYAYARAHDYRWWVDPFPSMDYRQHAYNEFGANSGLKAFSARWKKARSGWYSRQVLVTAEFCNLLDLELIHFLKRNSYIDRIRLIRRVFDLRKKKSEAIILAVMLAIPGFK